jgi:hypothetical protein
MGDRRSPTASSLSGAWSYRLARLGEPRPAAVECALGADQWREIAERTALAEGGRQDPMHDRFTGEPVRSVMNRPPTSVLSVGGQTRYASENSGAAMARNGPAVNQRGGRGGNLFVRDGNVVFRDQGAFDRAEREQLRTQRDQWMNLIAGNNARINDPTLAEPERSKLKMDNAAASAALQAIEARLQQLSRVPEVRP